MAIIIRYTSSQSKHKGIIPNVAWVKKYCDTLRILTSIATKAYTKLLEKQGGVVYNKRKIKRNFKKFMKKHLPWFHQSKNNTEVLEFPSILRFITEARFATLFFTYVKIFSISFVSGFLIIVILFQLSLLARNLAIQRGLTSDRQSILKEISYWQQVGNQYKNYRDIYFRIATLEYRLGNMPAAQEYVNKAMQLDPNFEQGKILGAQIKGK